MTGPRYLIGRGELLTAHIDPPGGGNPPVEVYDVPSARTRVSKQFADASRVLAQLPSSACPDDIAVVRIAMHPSFTAKSYFPSRFLRANDLQAVGSREITLRPLQERKGKAPREQVTTEIFVAGTRSALSSVSRATAGVEDESPLTNDIRRIEQIEAFSAADRLRVAKANSEYYEIGLHRVRNRSSEWVRSALVRHATELSIEFQMDLGLEAGGMIFLPARIPARDLEQLAQFSLVRVIRPLSRLRRVTSASTAGGAVATCQLPTAAPVSDEPRVAILDGGLPEGAQLQRWVRNIRKLDERAPDHPDGPLHGLAVTSAFLFGPISPGGNAERPFAFVDHLRVLDGFERGDDPYEMFRTLGHVEEVLLSRQYQFVNLSLGPDVPVEDADVHAWTSVIDDLLADGTTLLFCAAGNNGERDRQTGLNRVQVPGDGVNTIAVGACTADENWQRASYSAVGPGRRPGIVKPDMLAFGGTPTGYFHTLRSEAPVELSPVQGTSFSTPLLLRTAVGVRAVMGADLSPLAIKALLIHSADAIDRDVREVGWGRPPESVEELVTCSDAEARIVYQGSLKAGKYLRATIPLPKDQLTGMVTLRATFCMACEVDPEDAAAYTRAGLVVTFRPHHAKVEEGAANAKTATFFDTGPYTRESDLRKGGGKWETVLRGSKRMYGSSLRHAAFDIHYVARDSGGETHSAPPIPYALVLSVIAPKHPLVYESILTAHPQLVALQPQVSVPIRLR